MNFSVFEEYGDIPSSHGDIPVVFLQNNKSNKNNQKHMGFTFSTQME